MTAIVRRTWVEISCLQINFDHNFAILRCNGTVSMHNELSERGTPVKWDSLAAFPALLVHAGVPGWLLGSPFHWVNP